MWCCWDRNDKTNLVRKVFRMGGGEPDPHVRIDVWHSVQEVWEAQASLLWAVNCLKTTAECSQVGTTELFLWCVSVAVHVLTKQRHLLHTLKTNHKPLNPVIVACGVRSLLDIYVGNSYLFLLKLVVYCTKCVAFYHYQYLTRRGEKYQYKILRYLVSWYCIDILSIKVL